MSERRGDYLDQKSNVSSTAEMNPMLIIAPVTGTLVSVETQTILPASNRRLGTETQPANADREPDSGSLELQATPLQVPWLVDRKTSFASLLTSVQTPLCSLHRSLFCCSNRQAALRQNWDGAGTDIHGFQRRMRIRRIVCRLWKNPRLQSYFKLAGRPSIRLSPVGRSSITAKVTRQNLRTSSIFISPMVCLPNSSNERSHTLTPFKVNANRFSVTKSEKCLKVSIMSTCI